MRKWARFGNMKVFLLKTEVYIIEFSESQTRLEVLEACPWSFDNKPLIAKPWNPNVILER